MAEEVEVSMVEVVAEDVEEEMDKLEEDTDEEVVDEAVAHMKMELTSHMSPVTLRIQSGQHSQTIQGKGSLRTRYAQSSLQIKSGAPPYLSVLKRIIKIGSYIRLSLGFKMQAKINLDWQEE